MKTFIKWYEGIKKRNCGGLKKTANNITSNVKIHKHPGDFLAIKSANIRAETSEKANNADEKPRDLCLKHE